MKKERSLSRKLLLPALAAFCANLGGRGGGESGEGVRIGGRGTRETRK